MPTTVYQHRGGDDISDRPVPHFAAPTRTKRDATANLLFLLFLHWPCLHHRGERDTCQQEKVLHRKNSHLESETFVTECNHNLAGWRVRAAYL